VPLLVRTDVVQFFVNFYLYVRSACNGTFVTGILGSTVSSRSPNIEVPYCCCVSSSSGMQHVKFQGEVSLQADAAQGEQQTVRSSFYECLFAARAALLSRQLSRQRCHVTNVPCERAAPTGQTSGPSTSAAASGDRGVCTGTALPSDLLPPPLRQSRSEPKDFLTAEPRESRSAVSNLKVPEKTGSLENPTSTALSERTSQRQMQKLESFSRGTAVSQETSDAVAAPAGPKPQYGIPRANVGFKLLQKAGWKEGTGATTLSMKHKSIGLNVI
jgi:hypothetical protein